MANRRIIWVITRRVVSWTGLEAWGAEGHGPLADTTEIHLISEANASSTEKNMTLSSRESDEEFWEELHEIATDLMLILIVLHIAGVVVSSRLHKENLVKAMITGYKNKSNKTVVELDD